MADFVLIDGDSVYFDTAFPPAMVAVQPGRLVASGKIDRGAEAQARSLKDGEKIPLAAGANGKKICVEGDERSVVVPGCQYVTPNFPIAGVGTLRISMLALDQASRTDLLDGKRVLLKGSKFMATFEVTSAAKMQAGPNIIVDTAQSYAGAGRFETTNTKVKAS
jgi:hypothetical protein